MRTIIAVFLIVSPVLADSFGSGFTGYSFTPVFQNKVDSPGTPLIPVSYGGISPRPGEPGQLIVGGAAEGSGAAFYSVGVTRDLNGHIASLDGTRSVYATAPKLAGGASFGPSFNAGEVLFYSIASGSGGVDVGMIRWGTTATSKTVNIVSRHAWRSRFRSSGVRRLSADEGADQHWQVLFGALPAGCGWNVRSGSR